MSAKPDAASNLYYGGQAVMAINIWHNTGAVVGAILLQIGAVLMCCVMLQGVFSRGTAWLGIIMHGLDLTHLVCGWFVPVAGMVLMLSLIHI